MPSDGMDTSLCLVNMFFGKEPITFFFCHSVLKVPLHLVPSDYFRAAKYCIADVLFPFMQLPGSAPWDIEPFDSLHFLVRSDGRPYITSVRVLFMLWRSSRCTPFLR